MAFDNYDITELSDYNADILFQFADIQEEIDEREYDMITILNVIPILQECAAEVGISCDDAVAALQDFVDKYDKAVEGYYG